jgi:hypothetical protein
MPPTTIRIPNEIASSTTATAEAPARLPPWIWLKT